MTFRFSPPDDPDSSKVSLVTLKKPTPASFKPLPKPSRSSVPHSSVSAPSPAMPQKQRPPLPSRDIPGRGRNTVNSLSVPDPVFGSRLPAPNAVVKAPKPPSRSPTPPTNIVPQRRGNKFTSEDHEFFIKLLGWRLRQNPDLNRQELCEMLAEKVDPILLVNEPLRIKLKSGSSSYCSFMGILLVQSSRFTGQDSGCGPGRN